MKKYIIVMIFLISYVTNSQVEWELSKEFENFKISEIESFSKDTFVFAAEYNSLRNGNITFEWSMHLTTDNGNTWSRIYQDSTSIADLPREPLKIRDMEITKNGTFAFTREDGYLFTSKDYGNSWDSLLIFLPFERSTLLDSFEESIACYTNDGYIIIYDTESKDTSHINIADHNIVFENDVVLLFATKLIMHNNNFFSFLLTDITADSSYSYIHLTKDRGKTWEIIDNPRFYVDVLFVEENIIYGCGSTKPTESGKGDFTGVIDKSTDGGKTWMTVVNGKQIDYFFDVQYFQSLYMNSEYIICAAKTFNSLSTKIGNDNWQFDNLEPTTFENSGFMVDIACDDYGNCLAACQNNYILRNIRSESSISLYNDNNFFEYSSVSIYSYDGQLIFNSSSEFDLGNLYLPPGLYMKVFWNKYGKFIKSEKFIKSN